MRGWRFREDGWSALKGVDAQRRTAHSCQQREDGVSVEVDSVWWLLQRYLVLVLPLLLLLLLLHAAWVFDQLWAV